MLVDIRSLRLRRGRVPVLHDVHLALEAGEIYGLIGPNGAGKTTTLAAVLGLLAPEAGEVRVLGRNPRAAPPEVRARIGVLPQHNGFYDWMTGLGYLEFFAGLQRGGYSRGGLGARLEQVGLDAGDRRVIGTWSADSRRRLGLARALLGDPELLLLDEPTHGLDPRGRREVHDILLNLSSRHGVGMLLCTRVLDGVDRLCDRVGVLAGGCTVAEGPVTALVRDSAHRPRFRLRLEAEPPALRRCPEAARLVRDEGEWAVVELDPGAEPDQVWREMLFLGWPVSEIRRDGGGLEDLYLELTEGAAA